MAKVLIGDLFESNAQTLVNTVNCVGVMGKGIALEFKNRFPDMYKDYVIRCKKRMVKLGQPYLYKSVVGKWILNFPTKDHWRSNTKLNDIIRGLQHLKRHYKKWGIKSIAIPPLGCGYGQLEWRVVGPTMYRYIKDLEIPVELYAPYGTIPEELKTDFFETNISDRNQDDWEPYSAKVSPAWVALVDILNRIEDEPYHWPVGRTTFQKIAFVATEEGIPTGLEFIKSSYGPYSKDLKSLISKLLNNGLIYENPLGRMFNVVVGPTFNDAKHEFYEHLQKWEPALEKTADLFTRINTKQAELLTTVLFAYKSILKSYEGKPSEMEVFNSVMQWKKLRRPKLNESEVALTIRSLGALNWIETKGSPDLPIPHEDFCEI